MHRFLIASAIATVTLITSGVWSSVLGEGAAPIGHRLAYKFVEGDALRFESIQNVRINSQYQEVTESASNKTETRKHLRVVKVNPDGSAELDLVIDWVRMKANFGKDDPGIEFDSASPDAKKQPKFRAVLQSVGKPHSRMLVSPTGKVLKVHELSTTAPTPLGAQPITLKDIANSADFSFLTVMPETPLNVGENWKEKFDVKVKVEDNLQKTVSLQRTYTLDKVENQVAHISFKTAVLSPVTDPTVSVQLIQRETSGKIEFDIPRGQVISRTVDTDKSVIAPFGSNTAMHSTSHLLERKIEATAAADQSTKRVN